MCATLIAGILCALAGIALGDDPRNINIPVDCMHYYKTDTDPGIFQKGEDWTGYGALNIIRDPITGALKTEKKIVHVVQPTPFIASHDRTYQYTVDAGVDPNKDGYFYSRVQLNDKKGLGQQFSVAFMDVEGKVLDHVWTMPQEFCIRQMSFDADKVASIEFYARRFDR